MSAAIERPAATEYPPSYGAYIGKVPDGELLQLLEDQRRETQTLLAAIPDPRAFHRYAPGKWSIKEVAGHVADAERVFAYRALRFGRGDATPLAGFDARSLGAIAAELDAVRRATIALFGGLDPEALARRGQANGKDVSVRALGYVIAGHERHHVAILRERYLA